MLITACGTGKRIDLGQQLRADTPPVNESHAMAGSSSTAPRALGSSGASATPAAGSNTTAIDDTHGLGLPDAEVDQLMAGGPIGRLRWLYPYAGTVFPRDMSSPTLMWDGDLDTEFVYLHLKSRTFEYKTILVPSIGSGQVLWTNPKQPQVRIPQAIWDLAGQRTQGRDDDLSVELSTRVRGVVAGPISTHVQIAPASIKGSVYYSSYSSTLLGKAGNTGDYGSLLRIGPKRPAELALAGSQSGPGSCGGCHSVAANGMRMLSQSMSLNATITPQAWSYEIDPDSGAVGQPMAATTYAPIAALYPDGSKYLTGSLAGDPMLMGYGNPLVMPTYALSLLAKNATPRDATLYDTNTLAVIGDTGIPSGALMPSFSPDGTHLVFNDLAIGRAHGLAIMNYDTKLDKATRYRELMREQVPAGAAFTPDNPGWRPGWPVVLPDNKAVVFVRTDSLDFTATSSANLTPTRWAAEGDPNRQKLSDLARSQLKASDLHIADVATGAVTVLAKAMGFDTPADFAAERTYLPFGENDWHHNYYPTVSPVAAGGYFWVFFDSLRNYGNLGIVRQLWGTAIDIRADGRYTSDVSHPPFYVEGQEFGTDNHRAFAALEMCKPDTASCTSGVDCCGGYCMPANAASSGSAGGSCSAPPPGACAQHDDRCAGASDCCDVNDACINGFCAFVPLL